MRGFNRLFPYFHALHGKLQKNKYLYFLDEIPAMASLGIQIIIKTKKEIKWDINKRAEDTMEAEDTAAGRGRRTRRFARSASKNALSRLNRAVTVLYIARNVSRSVETAGVNIG